MTTLYDTLPNGRIYILHRAWNSTYRVRRAIRGLRRLRNPAISYSGVTFDDFLRAHFLLFLVLGRRGTCNALSKKRAKPVRFSLQPIRVLGRFGAIIYFEKSS